MLNEIKIILNDIEKLTDEFASWNEQRNYDDIISSAEEVTDKTEDMLWELKNEKKNEWLLYKLFWKDWSSKLQWYTSKRSIIFKKYDYLIEQLDEAEKWYDIYLNELSALLDKLKNKITKVKNAGDKEYIDKYIKNIIISFTNTVNSEKIKLEWFKSLREYMENNKVTFKASFSSIISQIEWQKFLNAVNKFNSTAYSAVNDINKIQSTNAVNTLKLIASIKENSSILSYEKLMESSRILEEWQKEFLLLK